MKKPTMPLRHLKFIYLFLLLNIFFVLPISAQDTSSIEPITSDSLCITKKYIKSKAPHAYNLWERCQSIGEKAYEGFPTDSCSVLGHPGALQFSIFLQPWLSGNVLDIGCGPQPLPSYLENYPLEQIAGIDPMEPATEKHPFTFCKGLAEFLPWADDTFDTVVIGTSLDHVILLDKVLDEIHRVLKYGGNLVIWEGFASFQTPLYNPYSPYLIPFDMYHLFHFSKNWFISLMQEKFDFVDIKDVSPTESFYVLQPKAMKKTEASISILLGETGPVLP